MRLAKLYKVGVKVSKVSGTYGLKAWLVSLFRGSDFHIPKLSSVRHKKVRTTIPYNVHHIYFGGGGTSSARLKINLGVGVLVRHRLKRIALNVCVCIYIYMYIYIYVYTHIHTYIYIHTVLSVDRQPQKQIKKTCPHARGVTVSLSDPNLIELAWAVWQTIAKLIWEGPTLVLEHSILYKLFWVPPTIINPRKIELSKKLAQREINWKRK